MEFQRTLGAGLVSDQHVPVKIVASNVTAVAAGYAHSLFIKSNGSLWPWETTNMGNWETAPRRTGTSLCKLSPATLVSVAAGGWISYAFHQADGSLWGMGADSAGQLATAPIQTRTFQSRSFPSPLETAASRAETSRAGCFREPFQTSSPQVFSMAIPADSAPNSVASGSLGFLSQTCYGHVDQTIGYRLVELSGRSRTERITVTWTETTIF